MLVKKEEKGDIEEVEYDGVLGKLPEALLDENKAHVENLHLTHSDLVSICLNCTDLTVSRTVSVF